MQARTLVFVAERKRRRFNRPFTASGQAVFAPCAISGAAYLRPGTRTESAASPFRCRILPANRAIPQRMRRKIERAATYSACPIPDLFVAATCMLQNVRSAIGQLSVRTLWRLHRGLACSNARSSAAVAALSGALSADLPHACADPQRSADNAPSASNLPSKDRVSGSSVPRPARFDTRPRCGSTRTDCRPLPRNSEAPVILRATKEPLMEREKNIRKTCRTRTVTNARTPD